MRETKAAGVKRANARPADAAMASKVWLRLRTEGHDKFWFASRRGASWTARWGHRGGEVNKKIHALASAAEARAAYEKAVRAKLAKGYAHAPEKEDAAIVLEKMSYVMVFGKKGDDVFGGIPAGVSKAEWPTCVGCEHPMPHVMLIHAHEERLPLKKHAAIALFACNGAFSGGTCETWEADAGCNAALLLTAEQLAVKALRAAPEGANGSEAPKVMPARRIAYEAKLEVDPAKNQDGDYLEAASKLGGYPVWVQGDEAPVCSRCKEKLRFVAQLQEVDDALNFGGGDGYLFCCPKEHEAKFLWQQ